MKIKLHHIVITACLASAAFISSASGQDAGMSDIELPETDRDRMLYSPGGEGEVRPKVPVTISTSPRDSKDSLATTTPTRVTAAPTATPRVKPETQSGKAVDKSADKQAEKQAPSKEDTDSILTFNFLYYIIQKYKLQDIVD
jgi:hypothetical protein